MANKWRVSVDNKFLGHYYGKTPETAVEKAIKTYSDRLTVKDGFLAEKIGSKHSVFFPSEDLEVIFSEHVEDICDE